VLLSSGEMIDARYRVSSLLGSGSMGAVYRAFDLRLRRAVALKVMHEKLSAESMARLVREARLSASLPHPNIVAVYDVGEHEGVAFMAMELVEGRPLHTFVGEPTPMAERIRWLGDIARALAAAHRAGLVHRDVKPQNVLVTASGAKLCDFGCAKLGDEGTMNVTALLPALRPIAGMTLGTPLYMAPEVLHGANASDARSDQFAWGLIAYELLVGRPPRRTTPWTPPHVAGVGIPPHVAAAIERALSDRSERFPAMDDIVDELERRPSLHPSPDDAIPQRASSIPVSRAPRSPTPGVLAPFLDAVRAELAIGVPLGFFKAVATIGIEGPSAFVSVGLVALDESAELWALAPSPDLRRAAAKLVAEDNVDGNGGWRWLALRLEHGSPDATVAELL